MSIRKSHVDTREYRSLELENGMKVVVIHDASADKASAALDVAVGSFSDPKELPGLAHFLEHMLFLGTAKYPAENEYNSFLSQHGGSSNAYTSDSHTNYYFDVAHDHLEHALDIFAQFFISPLFDESCTMREINAVDSENAKNLQNDTFRLYQLLRSVGNPEHPFSNFSTGNKVTLWDQPQAKGINVRDELIKFHETYYAPNLMALVVLGREPLDALEAMVREKFSAVPGKNVTAPVFSGHPFAPGFQRNFLRVVPVKEVNKVFIHFPADDETRMYATQPARYVAHMVGHEGPGSLLSHLKAHGWATGLSAGSSYSVVDMFSLFSVSIDLTPEGITHLDDIIRAVFQYIHMLALDGVHEWVFEECRLLQEMHFRFLEKTSPIRTTSELSKELHYIPAADILAHYYGLTTFAPEDIARVIARLTPEAMNVLVMSKAYTDLATSEEYWYKTKYHRETFSDAYIADLKAASTVPNPKLHMPPKNNFIPSQFDIHPHAESGPAGVQLVYETPLVQMWHKQDDTFMVPKGEILLILASPMAYADPLHASLMKLLTDTYKDSIVEYMYDAELSGTSFTVSGTTYGIDIQVHGYDHKLAELIQYMLARVMDFTVDEQRFAVIKNKYRLNLINSEAEDPYRRVSTEATAALSEKKFSNNELLAELDCITLSDLAAFRTRFLARIHIEGLSFGNIIPESAVKLARNLEGMLSGSRALSKAELNLLRAVEIPVGKTFALNVPARLHAVNAVEIFYQVGPERIHTSVCNSLVNQIIKEPCFSILRTQEQLGYIVYSQVRRLHGIEGLSIIIQSDRTPTDVEARVDAFMETMTKQMDEMTEETYARFAKTLKQLFLEKPKSLKEEFSILYNEIIKRTYCFDYMARKGAEVDTINKAEFTEFFHRFYTKQGAGFASLRARIHGVKDLAEEDVARKLADNAEGVEVIEDVALWKNSLRLHPGAPMQQHKLVAIPTNSL